MKVSGDGVKVTSVPRFGLPSTIGAGPTTVQLVDGVAVREVDDVLQPVAPDAQRQLGRKRVDDGDADAMQAAGNLVGILVEFSARVQLGHDDLGRRDALFVVDAGGDAAAVVGDGAGAVGVERHGDELGVAGERLVDGVVDDLVDHVMQARAVVGVADIHARAFAHRVEAAQHLDRIRAVGVAAGLRARRFRRRATSWGRPSKSMTFCRLKGRRGPRCDAAIRQVGHYSAQGVGCDTIFRDLPTGAPASGPPAAISARPRASPRQQWRAGRR